MNLFIHDIACAIERDATSSSSDFDRRPPSREAWLAEWQPRLGMELDSRDREPAVPAAPVER